VPKFDSAGVQLHYELHGSDHGRPIVLVHGYCSDYRLNWVGTRWQETLTGAGHRVIGLDCRGHGSSDKPHDPAAYNRAEMAQDVVRLLSRLEIEQADYLGYSMGGRIGLQLLVDASERVGRAVLGGVGRWVGASNPDHSELTARRMRGDASIADPMANMFYDFASARPVNDLEALACCILGPQQPITDEEMRAIPNDVLVCAGDQDPIARGGDELAARLGHGQFVPIPGRNHMNAVPARDFKDAAVAFLGAST
jgi:pimeloyl-ACP methyl ester carboxylesterase